jgi:hypothetical protein
MRLAICGDKTDNAGVYVILTRNVCEYESEHRHGRLTVTLRDQSCHSKDSRVTTLECQELPL